MADNNAPKPTGFTFGTPAPALGGDKPSLFSTPATTKPLGGFGFGSPQTTTAAPTGTAAPLSFGFGSGLGSTTTAPALSLGQPAAAVAKPAATGLTFGSAGTAALPTLGAAQTAAAATTTTSATGFSFPAPAATTASTGFTGFSVPAANTGLASTASTTTASGLSLTTPSQPATTTSAAPLTNLTTSTVTTQSAAPAAPQPNAQLNFCQLEEYINKWTLELEEQEKVFTNQATQINAWDRVLIENSDKIVALNEAVDKIKAEQKALEHELEYISAQHSDLDECIKPLEKELSKTVQVDTDREQTYLLAESLDTQLKQMGEDLKEVIEHLNEANKDRDPNDPIVQIGKILNAHMSSLQWIENSTTHITNKLEHISKLQDTLKSNERSFRLNN